MEQMFYFDTLSVIRKTEADILDYLQGKDYDIELFAIGDDSLPQLKRWLKTICNKIFVTMHKLSNSLTDAFVFDGTITVEDAEIENQISFTIVLPDNFDVNLTGSIDDAIEVAIIKNLMKKYLESKAIYDEFISNEASEAMLELKISINYRKTISRTYRMY